MIYLEKVFMVVNMVKTQNDSLFFSVLFCVLHDCNSIVKFYKAMTSQRQKKKREITTKIKSGKHLMAK